MIFHIAVLRKHTDSVRHLLIGPVRKCHLLSYKYFDHGICFLLGRQIKKPSVPLPHLPREGHKDEGRNLRVTTLLHACLAARRLFGYK